MLEELRTNPRSPEARSGGRLLVDRALNECGWSDPGLSTAFTEGSGLRSTATGAPFRSDRCTVSERPAPVCGRVKEEVA